ncbi:hypothetical protein JCM33374_g5780 [Metschnikowia sp. JCM 33374]|nr:hypothetical protein JCM33374_g5780 [Metschnikowia sp. JCM 33374]
MEKSSIQKEENGILELGNWVSSDDDSLDISLVYTSPQISKLAKARTYDSTHLTTKTAIPSSPIVERIPESEFNSEPSRHSLAHTAISMNNSFEPNPQEKEPSIRGSPGSNIGFISSFTESVPKRRRIPVSDAVSDPIESSSPMKSPAPPAKKSTKSSKSKNSDPNDRLSKAWKDANKVIRRKDDILSEMVIEIALCLEKKIETDYFKKIFLQPKVRNSYLEIPLITWKRRVTAKYNKEEDCFVPCDLTEISERILLLYYAPDELIDKLRQGLVSSDIEKAKRRANLEDPLKEYFVFIMVPGFNEYLRKLQTMENRQYRAKTLQQLNQTKSTTKSRDEPSMSSSEASRLLVDSEVQLGINIFTTKTVEESIDWLHSFTYTIASSIYDKFERNPDFANIGTVRSGSDSKSTFIEMMKKFNLMTDPKAQNLYQYYTCPLSLYTRLLENGDIGTVNGRNIVPPSVNKAMRRVFTSRDPDAIITD